MLLWGEILCLGGEQAEGDQLPGAVVDRGVKVAPPAIAARIRQVMKRVTQTGTIRMAAGLQAYLSVLGMELVVAVNDAVQRAQNGEKAFWPDDTTVSMQQGRPRGRDDGDDEEGDKAAKRPCEAKGRQTEMCRSCSWGGAVEKTGARGRDGSGH